MADRAELSCASSGASSNALSPARGKASIRIAAVLALAAFALGGCNASQGVNASSQRTLADTYPNYTPYNPIQYAQTSGFYGGR
jgi:ABC-type nitrate/sulfonate/bicarbonate transport system substrate-binding protein